MKLQHIFSMLVDNKKNNRNILVTSVLIAVGVNLLSSGISALIGIKYKNIILIILGILTIFITLTYYSYSKIKEISRCVKLSGFFIYTHKDHEIINIEGYKICHDLSEYLNAAFIENKALERIWKESDINPLQFCTTPELDVIGKSSPKIKKAPSLSYFLFIELLEYCIIKNLSIHLCDYFNGCDDKYLQQINRTDIPEVLLQNRFLNLFSEDMINRSIFSCSNDSKFSASNNERTVYACSKDGGIYERFNLTVPLKCKIRRDSKHGIRIETPILTMTINYNFDGFSTALKPYFEEYYLGLSLPLTEYSTYKFDVSVTVNFKYRSLFMKDKKMYYAWIDSYLENLSSYLSEDDFWETINWNTICTIIQCSKTRRLPHN